MYQRYLRVTLYRTHPVVEGDPSVGPQAAQRQSGGLSLPECGRHDRPIIPVLDRTGVQDTRMGSDMVANWDAVRT